jgi:AcrR family transcriptional regulator
MKTRMRGEERHAAIVRSAMHLFAAKGFRGTTTRELAAAVGVTEPVLYRHFRTKRELYNAIIEVTAGQASDRVHNLKRYAHDGDDAAFFSRVGEQILERYTKQPETTRLLLFSSLEGHEMADLFFERVFAGFFSLVTDYIRDRVRAGAFRKVDAEIAARALIGMFSYHGLVTLLFPARAGKRNQRRIAREIVTLFLNGILPS